MIDLVSAQTCDTGRYARFFHAMLNRGVCLPPSQFETWMLSFAHTEEDVAFVVECADSALQECAAT